MTDIVLAGQIGKHLQKGVVTPPADGDRRDVWKQGDARDQRVAIAHEALEQGRALVDLHTVLARGGQAISPEGYSSWFPALAVARADLRAVTVRCTRTGTMKFSPTTGWRRWSMTFPNKAWAGGPSWRSAKAAAPVMPPDIRPSNPKNFLFLWEAQWRDVREARPPIHIDPALLEHVAGTLYRVVGIWDLTDLEAAALR